MSESETIERQLRDVEHCQMKPEYEGAPLRGNWSLALKAARLIKRQRERLRELGDDQ